MAGPLRLVAEYHGWPRASWQPEWRLAWAMGIANGEPLVFLLRPMSAAILIGVAIALVIFTFVNRRSRQQP